LVEAEMPEERYRDGNAKWEFGQIPDHIRAAVAERDQGICRVCGGTVGEAGALHHIVYRSQGGRNVVENLITVHWMFWPRCHERMHSNVRLYRPLEQRVVHAPGVTVLQLLRWQRLEEAKQSRAGRTRVMSSSRSQLPGGDQHHL